MRELLVFTDGARFASGCRFHLAGKTDIGLFPSLFTLQAWNLREKDYLLLASAKTLEVRRGDSCLALGKVTDVFRRTVPEGTVTVAAFSPGLELWEAPVSLAVEAGASVSDTVRGILAASGTVLASQITDYIRDTPGVLAVEDVSFSVSGRQFSYACTVRTEEGTAGVTYEAGG